jgi:uncharacterized protein YegL
MKKIDIICILDMSGSMCSIIEKAREGFNQFLKDQKNSDNKVNLSLLFFDDKFYMPYNNVDIQKVKKVNEKTYYACGGTALYDAIGKMIDDYLDNLASTKKEDRSDKSLFVIITDGGENASRVYHKQSIKLLVTHMREEFNSEFIYLGANQDSAFEAEMMGMDRSNAFDYAATDEGITVAYANISKATAYYASTDVKENLFQK